MIRIGTCSWKYDSWKEIIYPDKGKFNFLEEYSKHYNTVEIDQWFWSLFDVKKVLLPKDSDVKAYTQSVPEKFRFSIKIPNSITLTHFYNKDKKTPLKKNPHFFNPELFQSFLSTLKPTICYLKCPVSIDFLRSDQTKKGLQKVSKWGLKRVYLGVSERIKNAMAA